MPGAPERDHDHSGVIVPPPAIYLVLLLAGAWLDHHVPLPVELPIGPGRLLGGVLAVCALVLVVWSFRRFWAAGTSVVPVKPTTALVIAGPYRFTRNPIYLGVLSLYLALAVWFGLVWPILLVPVVIGVVNAYVIAREERYLERKFGDDYRQYRARVRRWL